MVGVDRLDGREVGLRRGPQDQAVHAPSSAFNAKA